MTRRVEPNCSWLFSLDFDLKSSDGADQRLRDRDRGFRMVADDQQPFAGALWSKVNAAWHHGDGFAGIEHSGDQGSGRAFMLGTPNGIRKSNAKSGVEIIWVDLIKAKRVAEFVER